MKANRQALAAAAVLVLAACTGGQDPAVNMSRAQDDAPAATPPPTLTVGQNFTAIASENAFYVDEDGVRVTNLPMFGSVGTGGVTYEELYGPRAANATIGSGALTTGFDPQGRLTVFNWPGPGHHDHINFLNISRGWPNMGAPENGGAFGGVVVESPAGETRQLWLHPDFGWEIAQPQHYADPRSQTVVTQLVHPELELEATITDAVHPELDVLARNFAFRARGGHRVTAFAHYANMNPTTSRVPRVPSVFDAFLDNVADFATRYDDAAGALVHSRPYTLDPAAASRLLTSQPGSALWQSALADAVAAEGVAIAVGGRAAPAAFQAGLDTLGLPLPGPFSDPYYTFADGVALAGTAAAVGKTAGALSGLPADADGSYSVYLAAGRDPDAAVSTLEQARGLGFAGIRAASQADWARWLGRARLPASSDARTLDVARRALMLIRTAQDRQTGAIVANATPQTPYREDWVRDGAFFNYALLLAGYPDMVLAHNRFYTQIYRLGGTWDSFYYTDGGEAGAIFPYEIDSQAFAIWALTLPFELGAIDAAGLAEFYPAIRDTANAIMLCYDPLTGLQCYASEDDNPVPTQEAQGAATVFLALNSAADAAKALGDAASAERWRGRAAEIRAGTLAQLCSADDCPGGRGGIYLAWPSRLLSPDEPDTAALLQSHLQKYVAMLDAFSDPDLAQRKPDAPGFFQYPMEPVLALAPAWESPGRGARLDRWLHWLTHEVPEPGVLHYGERIFRCEGRPPYCVDSGQEYLHSVGFPHIWSGTEAYIAAAFVDGLKNCPRGTRRIGEARCR